MGQKCCKPVIGACNSCLDLCDCDPDEHDVDKRVRQNASRRSKDKVYPLGSKGASNKNQLGQNKTDSSKNSKIDCQTSGDAEDGRRSKSKPLAKLKSRYGPQPFVWKGKSHEVSIESLAWTKCHNKEGQPFYYSPLTGQTTWERPDEYVDPCGWFSSLATLHSLKAAVDACNQCGIQLFLFGDVADPPLEEHNRVWNAHDHVYGKDINGSPPILGHCLFYQPFLVSELLLYPKHFLSKCGVQRIVLVDALKYRKQSRKAIPVVETGTLYIDPTPEAIQYMHSVFHHELFHVFDDKILSFLKGRMQFLPEPISCEPEKRLGASKQGILTDTLNDASQTAEARDKNSIQVGKPQVDPLYHFARQICFKYIESPDANNLSQIVESIATLLNIWDKRLSAGVNSNQIGLSKIFPVSVEHILQSVPPSYFIKMLMKEIAFSDCPPMYEFAILLNSIRSHLKQTCSVRSIKSGVSDTQADLSLGLDVKDEMNIDEDDPESDSMVDVELQRIVQDKSNDSPNSQTSFVSEGNLHIEMNNLEKPNDLKSKRIVDSEVSLNKDPRAEDTHEFAANNKAEIARIQLKLIIPAEFMDSLNRPQLFDKAYSNIDLEKIGSDPIWLLLNPPGFSYGGGGHRLRTKTSTFSMTHDETRARMNKRTNNKLNINELKVDKDIVDSNGFLNEYSMSGIEEDKAEIYAALIRSYTAVINSRDRYVAAKGSELMRRLQLFCPNMNEEFFRKAHEHQPFPVADASSGSWVQRVDRRGYPHWYNTETHQTSWIDPATFLKVPPLRNETETMNDKDCSAAIPNISLPNQILSNSEQNQDTVIEMT